jgi:predicted TPR repeat methyltransferase
VDLILALDVLIYVGALEAAFAAAARVLVPEGRLVFTVESLDAPGDLRLLRTGRFAHSHAYVETCARDAGLALVAVDPLVIRKDAGVPIAGAIYTLTRPRAPAG